MLSSQDHSDSTEEPETTPGNLPVQLTRLLGREPALEELRALLWRTRLLTLCGPGGAGKSRLGCALAESVGADLVGGAWWADLSDSVDSSLVAQAVAADVLPGAQINDPAAAVARWFAGPSLLVLDNCGQVVPGAAALAMELLARAPGLRIIATSRQPLGIPGEHVWRVPGLPVEDPATLPRGSRWFDDPAGGAIGLFMQRACESAASFASDGPGVRESVAEICRWLDGMPLAIELAAARVAVLGVGQIAERLQRDTGVLRQTGRAAPGRPRGLQEMLEWSHQMLEPDEQRLFRRLASFRGSFSLEAAEAVCSDQAISVDDVLDLLALLIDRSLVHFVDSPDRPRYRLLATVRQYAAVKLLDSGELEQVRRRHAQHYFDVGEQAREGLAGVDHLRWLEGLELEHENLADALLWLFENEPAEAADLASALWRFSYQHGYYREARSWFEQVLACGDEIPARARIDALLKAGEVAFLQCEYEVAISRLEEALAMAVSEAGPDRRPEAIARQRLGSIAREQGRHQESRRLHLEALSLWEGLGDAEGVASSRNYLAFVAWLAGDFPEAEEQGGLALAQFRRAQNAPDVAATLVSLGASALYAGNFDLAAERLGEALQISRRLGFQEGIAWSLHELAVLSHHRRRGAREPEMMLRDALLVHQQLGDRWRMSSVLEEVAGSVLARADPALAVRLLSGAGALRERIGAPVPLVEAPDREAALARLRRRCSAAAFDEAWSLGRVAEVDELVDLAVAAIETLVGSGAAGDHAGGQAGVLGDAPARLAPILTPRELAVLELLSQGQTNREIAGALYISPSTAGVHVSNILSKLRAKRRVDAAAMAHGLGLLPGV